MQKPINNIVLIGMMGTGKSTVGASLAAKTGLKLVDLDQRIVEKAGLTIPEIFRENGEETFRNMEASLLDSALEEKGVVIATGGGVVLREENRCVMLNKGLVIALKAAPEEIVNRVGEDDNRPLLAGGARERIMKLLEERKHAYDFAHYTIDTTGKSVEQVTVEILTRYRG